MNAIHGVRRAWWLVWAGTAVAAAAAADVVFTLLEVI